MSQPTSVFRRLLSLSLPVMGLNVLAVLALAVDTAMCGRLPDAEVALAGLGYSTQLVFLLAVGIMGLSVGTVALSARAFGASKLDDVNRVLAQSGMLAIGIGLVVVACGGALARPLLSLLGASGPTLEAGADYLKVVLLGSPFYYLTLLYAAALRAAGETRTAFLTQIVSNAINVGINYVLIFGNFGFPAMGVQGAALSTVISQLLNVLMLGAAIQRGVVPGLRLAIPRPLIEIDLVRSLFRTGWPAALDILIMNAAFLSVIGMLGRIDDAAVAAHGVGLRLQALAFVPGLGVSQATAALIGQSLGAGNADEARRVFRASLLLCVAIMSGLGVLIMAGAEPILGVFDIDVASAVGSYSITWMLILGAGMPLIGAFIAIAGVLMGSGATMASLRINLLTTFLVQIPIAALLAFPLGFGAAGAWCSFPIAGGVKLMLGTRVYRTAAWAVTGTGTARDAA